MNKSMKHMRSVIKELGLDAGHVMVDAIANAFVDLRKADLVLAKQNSPNACALARAACRLPDVVQCWFYRSVVWIHQVGDDGEHRFIRYIPSSDATAAIRGYDDGKPFPPGRYKIRAPSSGTTLKHKNKVDNEYRARLRKAGIPAGKRGKNLKIRHRRSLPASVRGTHAEI